MFKRYVQGVVAGVLAGMAGVGGTATIAIAQPDVPSKVPVAFNKYYDYEQTTKILQDFAAAYPELVTLKSIGKSLQGREMWLVIVNAPKTGPHDSKPAMWIDGNIHGNEVQASEVVIYTLWMLTKSYGTNAKLTDLLDRCSFYLVPMMNPDGRQFWFDNANTPHSSRHNQRLFDKDMDGEAGEDPPDDLDKDGHITQMWREDPQGRWVRSQTDERVFVRLRDDQTPAEGVKTYTNLGEEGIDNDGDGRKNEDGPFGDDMNRNWPGDWQPMHIQGGAGPYPFSAPETRAVGTFVLAHPNIGAAQSYHNTGGMILRGPGAAYREGKYTGGDVRVYDELQNVGSQMLPYYRSMVLFRDLYRVHGGEVNWFAESLGVFSFTNELWTAAKYFQRDGNPGNEEQQWMWRDRMQFGELFSPLKPYEHPQYGTVLIGGLNKWSSRITPPFMLEEECHRNFAFTMFHADQMPELKLGRVDVVKRNGALWQVTAEIRNTRLMPTRSEIQRRDRIGRNDLCELVGDTGVKVIAAAKLDDWFDLAAEPISPHEPARVQLPDGIPGRGKILLRWFVEGNSGSILTLRYASEKARTLEATIELK